MLKFISIQHVFKNIKEFNARNLENTKNAFLVMEEKSKGTRFENLFKYWKTLYIDYRDVAVDVIKDVRERPLKAASVITVLGSLSYCAKHNPSMTSYRDNVISAKNKLLLVHPSMQNADTVHHLKQIEHYFNSRCVRRLNLGIFCLIWADYYSDACSNSQAKSKYLQMKYTELKNHIVDVGFLGQWWILTNVMGNYDINY